jgi:hypothetical protein
MTRAAHDVFLIHIPDSQTLPRLAWRYDAVVRAMHELGPKARVLRVTEDEYCRDMTDEFKPKREVDEDEEAGDWRGAHTRHMSRIGSFGRR